MSSVEANLFVVKKCSTVQLEQFLELIFVFQLVSCSFISLHVLYHMCYSFRLMRRLSKVETRRDGSFALYITIINCLDE